MASKIIVQYFQNTNPEAAACGRWGFKIKEFKGGGWFNTHKTAYEFLTRHEAVMAAKDYVNAHHPGQWLSKKKTRKVRY